jgi:hypothetical protein
MSPNQRILNPFIDDQVVDADSEESSWDEGEENVIINDTVMEEEGEVPVVNEGDEMSKFYSD